MTMTERIAEQIATGAPDTRGLLEDYRAAVRAEMKRDLLADLSDPKMEIETGDDAREFIESNY